MKIEITRSVKVKPIPWRGKVKTLKSGTRFRDAVKNGDGSFFIEDASNLFSTTIPADAARVIVNDYPDSPNSGAYYGITDRPIATGRMEKFNLNAEAEVYLARKGEVALPGKWSAKFPVPEIGARVDVRVNGFKYGKVVAYFVESGFLGIEVECEVQPDWHVKQNGLGSHPLVFGMEIELPEETCDECGNLIHAGNSSAHKDDCPRYHPSGERRTEKA